MFTRIVVAILFTIVPTWKVAKCPITKLHSLLYTHRIVYALLPIKMMMQKIAQ